MPYLLTQHELERRLLRWVGSASVPRYPFYEPPNPYSATASQHLRSTSTHGLQLQDLNRWFYDIELAAHDCEIAEEQYADAAIYFLRGEMQEVMCERREVYLERTRRAFWVWKDFKMDLTRIVQESNVIIGEMATEAFNVFALEIKKFLKLRIETAALPNIPDAVIKQVRFVYPYIASSLKTGLIIGGTAVALPALGLLAWKKMQATQAADANTSAGSSK